MTHNLVESVKVEVRKVSHTLLTDVEDRAALQQDSGPVGGQVAQAIKEVSEWPEWMRRTAKFEGPGAGLPPTEQTQVSTAPGASDGPALKCPNPECKNGYDGKRRVGSWDWYYAETRDEQKALEAAKHAPSEFFAEHGSRIEPQDRLTIECRAYHAAMTEGMVLVSREDAEFSEFMLRRVAVSENDSQCFDVSDRLREALTEGETGKVA